MVDLVLGCLRPGGGRTDVLSAQVHRILERLQADDHVAPERLRCSETAGRCDLDTHERSPLLCFAILPQSHVELCRASEPKLLKACQIVAGWATHDLSDTSGECDEFLNVVTAILGILWLSQHVIPVRLVAVVRIVLCGFSMGATAAAEIAVAYGKRLGGTLHP
eukprot:6130280-Amphidinium_carterae.1